MPNSADAQRRWLGMFCLAIASGMLIWGRTLLVTHLVGQSFLIYWALCAVVALGAVGFGFADIWLTIRTLRERRRKLVRDTLKQIRRPESGEKDDPHR